MICGGSASVEYYGRFAPRPDDLLALETHDGRVQRLGVVACHLFGRTVRLRVWRGGYEPVVDAVNRVRRLKVKDGEGTVFSPIRNLGGRWAPGEECHALVELADASEGVTLVGHLGGAEGTLLHHGEEVRLPLRLQGPVQVYVHVGDKPFSASGWVVQQGGLKLAGAGKGPSGQLAKVLSKLSTAATEDCSLTVVRR